MMTMWRIIAGSAVAMLLMGGGCSPENKAQPGPSSSLTTDTDSQTLPDKEERLEFLARYLRLKSPIADAEFVIRYHDNSGGAIPGPSDWDIQAVLQVDSDIEPWRKAWAPCADDPQNIPPQFDVTWADDLLRRRPHWQNLKSSPRCYRNPSNASSYAILYEQDKLVLYKNTTLPN